MNNENYQFDPVYRLLALAARINPDEQDKKVLSHAISTFSNWEALVTEAENNAVAPLLFTSLRDCGAEIPQHIKRKLYALVQRHRWANQARAEAMAELSEACKKSSIQLIVLKGSYLAHTIYPDPSLRTMSDIDLLAPQDKALAVQQILRDLGYTVPDHAGSQYMSEHHHLPGAYIERNGVQIHVEVHHDALSGDAPASITTKNLTSELKDFSIEGANYTALGHQDQLRHLYHHMSEPASKLKLIWCLDIVYFASHFEKEIDWPALGKNYPQVINAFRLVDYIIPLPENLRQHIPLNQRPMPAGTGVSILPLSTILREPVKQRVKDLLNPSSWWLRLYYGVSPDDNLLLTRWIRHPWQVMEWVIRRIRASRQLKLAKPNFPI
ncbi:MAG: nucleotidyltransferase family protein [Arenicellales bacterium]